MKRRRRRLVPVLCGLSLGLVSVVMAVSGCRGVAPPPAAPASNPAPPAGVAVSDGGTAACASAPPAPISSSICNNTELGSERDEVTRALAEDPNNPERLVDAAELYLSRLPATTTRSEIGLLYSRRGIEQLGKKKVRAAAQQKSQRALLGRLELLEGQALLDLGRAQEALRRLEELLHSNVDLTAKAASGASIEVEARYERAVALFELCRLAEAKSAFEQWLAHYPHEEPAAWAHHHLGLCLEMLGLFPAAERELLEARRLQPEQFFELLPVSQQEFRALVDEQAKTLSKESIADLKLVSLETADLPDLRDLTIENPPLSPTILGLYRGLPQGQEPSEPRAIVLYRLNLLRSVHSREELINEIHTTLLHELGHLHGADDEELRQQGLE